MPAFSSRSKHATLQRLEPITRERVEYLRQGTQRICFEGREDDYLKRKVGSSFVGNFKIPFLESIDPLLCAETACELENDKYGKYWAIIRTEAQFESIQEWIENNREIVFIKSALSLCIAMSMHKVMDEDDLSPVHTELGDLERRAKYKQDPEAREELLARLIELRRRLPFYRDDANTVICAVPPRPDKGFDLPSWLARELAAREGLPDITPNLRWKGQKGKIKEVAVAEKWDELEKAGLDVGYNLSGWRVILIDDLYQSGTTMQFVARSLQQAGAEHIFGLSVVKSMKNSDNQSGDSP